MKKAMMLAAAAILTLTGCNNNKIGENPDKPGENPETSDQLNIGALSTVDLGTRAELPAGNLTSGSIGVFAERNSILYATNVKYDYGSSSWVADPGTSKIMLTDVAAKVYAYYPYTTGVSTTVTIADNTSLQTDYLYSGYVKETDNITDYSFTKTNNTVNPLKMYHALAKVVFTKAQDTNYPGSGVITSITLKNKASGTALAASGSMNIQTGVITPAAATGTIYTLHTGTSSFKDGAITGTKMVIPTTIASAGDVIAEVVMDGITYNLNIPAVDWAKGTVNTYTLTVESSELIIQRVEVQDWTTGLNISLPITNS